MMMRAREYTEKYECPETPDVLGRFLQQLLSRFKLVVTVGLPCTGKSTVLSHYESSDGCTTIWNRQPIFDMLFIGGERDEKYNNYIEKFEHDVIPSLLLREHHQVLVDGWHRMPTDRAKLLGLLPKGLGGSALLVFDGPEQMILDRMAEDPRYNHLHIAEREEMVTRMKDTTRWPTSNEGYDSIIYLNTFGDEGRVLFSQVVTQKRR